MKDIIKTALGIGITIGLSNREEFVKQVSGVIQQYQEDPEKADKWSQTLISYLEQTRNNMNLQSAMKGAMGGTDMPDKDSIDYLTKAIKELSHQIEQAKTK